MKYTAEMEFLSQKKPNLTICTVSPDKNKGFTLQTDTSGAGIEGVGVCGAHSTKRASTDQWFLQQEATTKGDMVHTNELEWLTVVSTIQHFRFYLSDIFDSQSQYHSIFTD